MGAEPNPTPPPHQHEMGLHTQMGPAPQRALNPNAAPQCSPTPKPPHPIHPQTGSALRRGRRPRGGPPPNRGSPSAQTGAAPTRGSHGSPPPLHPISTQMGSEPNRALQCNAVGTGSAPKGVPHPPPPPSAPRGVQRPKRVPRPSAPPRPSRLRTAAPAIPANSGGAERDAAVGSRSRSRFGAAPPVPQRPAAPGVPKGHREHRDRIDGTRRYRTGTAGGVGGGKRHRRGAQRYRKEPLPQRPAPGLKAAAPRPVPTAGTAPPRPAAPLPPPPTPGTALTSGPAPPLCYAAVRSIAIPIAGPGPPAPPRTALRPDPLPGAPGRGLKGAAAVRCGAARSSAGGSGAAGEARAERSVRAHARE